MKFFKYYTQKTLAKINLRLISTLSSRLQKTPYGWRYTPKNFSFSQTVIFAFHDERFIHLGDQLFHTSSIRATKDAGFNVGITGKTPLFDFLTHTKKIDHLSLKEAIGKTDSIVIGAHDSVPHLIKNFPKATILGVSYYPPKGVRIADHIHNIIGGVLSEITNRPFPKTKKDYWSFPDIPKAQQLSRITIYNDFVASGLLEATKQRLLLRKYGRSLWREGALITYIGSPQEAQFKAPDFISKDCRGHFSIQNIMILFFSGQVKSSISFDTFLAHLAILSKTPTCIMPRKSKWGTFLKDHFFPMSCHISTGDVVFISDE